MKICFVLLDLYALLSWENRTRLPEDIKES